MPEVNMSQQLPFIKLYNGRGKKVIRHKNVTEDMFWLLESGLLKDISVESENGKVKYSAHKSVLSARIPHFRRRLSRAERSGEEISVFKLPNITTPVMQYFLCFVYCGHLGIKAGLREEEAKQLVEISNVVMLPELAFFASEMCPFIMLGDSPGGGVSMPFPCLSDVKTPEVETTPPGTPPLLTLSPNSKIPKPQQTFAGDILNLVSDPFNSNVIISYPDTEGVKDIKSNSSFLVARCPFFEHQICGEWNIEVDEKSGRKICPMDPNVVPYSVLLDVLRYVI